MTKDKNKSPWGSGIKRKKINFVLFPRALKPSMNFTKLKLFFYQLKELLILKLQLLLLTQDLALVGMANATEIYCCSVLTLAQIFFFFLCFILIPSHLTILFLRAE